MEHKNMNLDNIVTPVNPDRFEEFLVEAGYDQVKTEYIINDFREGFSIE